MARFDFGGTLADFVVTSHRLGNLDALALSAATLTMWSAQSGGTRYTDLVLNGSAVTSISVGTDGQVPKFQGPDGVTEMWADGGSTRIRIVTLQGAPGPVGPAGLPGVNAIPANDAVAAYLTAPGATADALTAVVTGRLATDPTPANAAAAAVSTKLTEAGVLSGAFPYAGMDDVAFALLDSAGRKSWLEVAGDGSAPQRVRALLAAWVAANLPAQSIHAGSLGTDIALPGTTANPDVLWALVDSSDRMAATVTGDGSFDVNKVGPTLSALIAARVAAATSTFATPIAAWGDSLTAAGWPAVAASTLGVSFSSGQDFAIGGQGVESIAARQGGRPALVTAPITIPATTTPVAVTLDAIPYSSPAGTGTTSGDGVLYGIPGTLTRDNVAQTHTFTRATAGTATWVPATAPFIPSTATTARDKPMVIWTGRNSFNAVGADALIVDYVRRMVAYSTALRPRFLVLEIPPFVGDETGQASRTKLDAANLALRNAYPNEYVPVATYLRSDQAFTDAGVSKTAQDITDIGNGLTPTSFRSDTGHPNATGTTLIGNFVAAHIRQRGWVA